MLKNSIFFAIITTLVLSVACTSYKGTNNNQSTSQLNLAIWKSYIAPETVSHFEKQFGIKVNITHYSSNEDLYEKIKAGETFDLAVPSDYMVAILAKEGMLSKLDKKNIKNIKNVSANFLNLSYDPLNNYSLPYAWTTTGVAYNSEKIKTPIRSWKDLFMSLNKEKALLLESMRDVTGSLNKLNGVSVNTVRSFDIKKLKENIKSYQIRKSLLSSDTVDLLKEGKAHLVQAYSSDGLQAMKATQGKIQFVLPKEGVIVAVDNLVMPKNSVNKREAYEFIDFILTAETNAVFVREIMGGPVVKNVQNLVSKNLASNEALFPREVDFKRFERLEDLGKNTQLYDDVWSEVSAK